MCEVEDGDRLELFKKEKSLGTKCMKCKEGTAAIIIRVGDAFCRSCFREYFVHKFRAMLGKNRVVYPGEKVLLAYSGGPSSSAMIQQVQEGLSRDAPKKLRFVPGILFVDEGAVCGQSWEDREKTVSEVEHVLRGTGFPYHIVALEEVLSLPSSVLQRTPPGSSAQKQNYKQAVGLFLERQHGSTEESHITDQLEQLRTGDSAAPRASDTAPTTASRSRPPAGLTEELTQLFTQTKTLTAKQELLHTLRTHLILHTARNCGYSKVMSGESCTRLSVSLLSNISLGRGAFLPLDTGFSDNRFGDVTFIRPMREYSLKEISFNNRLFDVPSIFIPTLDTKAPDNSSIQRLSETFITRLQADFPSTVSTVYRTSEKLNLSTAEKRQEDNRQEKCLLCLCPLDTCVGSASAFQATEVSQRLSQRTVYGTETPAKDCENTCGNAGHCCEQEKKVPAYLTRGAGTPGIFNMLCYSCRLTVKELKSLDKMPQYILHEAEHRSCRREMRKEIQEFLLEDADV